MEAPGERFERRGIVLIYLLQDASLFQPCFQHFCRVLDKLVLSSEVWFGEHWELKGEKKRGGCTQLQCLQHVLDRFVIIVTERVEKERTGRQVRKRGRVNGSDTARSESQVFVGEEAKCTSWWR